MWPRKLRAILRKADFTRFSQEPCWGCGRTQSVPGDNVSAHKTGVFTSVENLDKKLMRYIRQYHRISKTDQMEVRQPKQAN